VKIKEMYVLDKNLSKMAKNIIFLLILLVANVIHYSNGEIYDQYNFHLFENFEVTKNVYQEESNLLKTIEKVKETLQQRKNYIENYLKAIKCDKTDLNSLKDDLSKVTPLMDYFHDLNKTTSEFPTLLDFSGAVKGMIRVQFAYKLNLTALTENGLLEYLNSHGTRIQFNTHERLRAFDFTIFAEKAMELKMYSLAIDFLREASRLFPNEGGHYKLGEGFGKKIKKLSDNVVKLHNGYLTKKRTIAGTDFLVHPYLVDKKLKAKKKHQITVDAELMKNLKNRDELSKDYLFMKICRKGPIFPPLFMMKRINCRYLHHNDPYLKLGPFKEEQASELPYVVIFHDILSENETDWLITNATPKLSRDRDSKDIGDNVKAKHETLSGSKRRVVSKTVQTWFDEVEWPDIEAEYVGDNYTAINYPNLWKISQRIGLATQFKTTGQRSATTMQVTNYGLGGLCELHIDPHGIGEVTDELPPSRKLLTKTGDYVGTFMAWLNDVEAGGGTAFAQPGFDGVVMPKKGAAAFWYDLFSDGRRDHTSKHGGCPVLKGSKWILNKWIYQYDNFVKFPCLLAPYPYNAYYPPDDRHYF
jgi:prolyl 4-hydroxylase